MRDALNGLLNGCFNVELIAYTLCQASRDLEQLDATNASSKWQFIAYECVNPLQKAYLAGVDSLSKGDENAELVKVVNKADVVLRQLLELEKKAQNCYIDAQLSILERTEPNLDVNVEEKKKLNFHFFCSHVSAEMATHVSATALDLQHRGCRVWTDQQGRLDIDAFGMVRYTQREK